jgi:hypothetical protein
MISGLKGAVMRIKEVILTHGLTWCLSTIGNRPISLGMVILCGGYWRINEHSHWSRPPPANYPISIRIVRAVLFLSENPREEKRTVLRRVMLGVEEITISTGSSLVSSKRIGGKNYEKTNYVPCNIDLDHGY